MSIYQVSKFADHSEPSFSFRRFLENTANLGLIPPLGAVSATSVVSLAHPAKFRCPWRYPHFFVCIPAI
jgi:hypothetical protein